MFESGSYKSLPEHVALYKALEASMERAQRDEFLAKKDKSRKRGRDNQDHPPPLPDLDLIKEIPMPDTANISDSKDADSAHLPKIKQSPEWLKPISDDESPATLKLAWVIPSSHIPEQLGQCFRHHMEECHKILTDQINWANLEGDQVRIDISKPLPLNGLPGHVTIQT
nr:hypothetical protein [Tanacetum cinerariifolium]GEX81042.1 hypothetical protein [Tanacetum cinerariifolium]